jgi:hypothetical protein
MRTYLIAYDLAKTTLTKHAIATELMRIGSAWARPLEATWYVQTELEGAAIEARLAGLLDTDDGLLIQPVQDAATLCNTALRWFRQRRDDAVFAAGPANAANVVAFPTSRPQFAGHAVAA